MDDKQKQEAAKRIKDHLKEKKWDQTRLNKEMKKANLKGGTKRRNATEGEVEADDFFIERGMMSRVLKGAGSDRILIKISEFLGLPDPEKMVALKICTAQGFWSSPCLALNYESGQADVKEFFANCQLTAYSDKKGEPIFSAPGKHLGRFQPDLHNFFFSGEVISHLKHGTADIGFVGSTLEKINPDFVRVARVVDAGNSRHAILVVSPKGTFNIPETKGEDGKKEKDYSDIIEYLLQQRTEGKPEECTFLFQGGSTSEREHDLLFKGAHSAEEVQILDLEAFKKEFRGKLEESPNKVFALIALMLTVDAAKNVVEALNEKGADWDVEGFRTSEFLKNKEIQRLLSPKDLEFFFELVIRHDRILEVVRHPGFSKLLTYLKSSVDSLNKAKSFSGKPPQFLHVAEFYGLDKDKAIERMRDTDYCLLFYPGFVEKLVKALQGNAT